MLGTHQNQPLDLGGAVQGAAVAVGGIAHRVPRAVAFPFGLLAIVGAFLLVQHRIDRRDPKLAMAPVTQAHFEFGPPPPPASAG